MIIFSMFLFQLKVTDEDADKLLHQLEDLYHQFKRKYEHNEHSKIVSNGFAH